MKKGAKVIILVIVITTIGLLVPVYKYIREVNRQLKEGAKGYIETYTPGTEAYKAREEMEKRIDEQLLHEQKGEVYFKEGKYDLAIVEYKKALEIAHKYHGNVWVPRLKLSRVYEKAGMYELAIQEISWLISKKPREDVIKELQQRKANLEKLLQQQTRANEQQKQ